MLSPFVRPVRFAGALSFLVGGALAGSLGCGDGGPAGAGGQSSTSSNTSSSTTSEPCADGVIVEGRCEVKCSDDKCVAGNVCVDNRCKLLCDTHADCNTDQSCSSSKRDSDSSDVFVCVASGKAAGLGVSCPLGDECGGLYACPDGAACDPGACGGHPEQCVVDKTACKPGETSCTIGKCGDGSACVVSGCDAATCSALSCRSEGELDADAYCTLADCKADADCAPGYGCAIVADPHQICGSDPVKPKGGALPCIDPADFTKDGHTYQEGPLGILRNMCVKRDQCSSCETDLDCSAITTPGATGSAEPVQRCVDVAGSKHCARGCSSGTDCDPDKQCANGYCIPRFEGGCVGTGKFCEPCSNDLECGGTADNAKACVNITGDQYGCFDLSFPDACPSGLDSECPLSPSLRRGHCLDEADGVGPTDAVYHRCYFPQKSGKFGCW